MAGTNRGCYHSTVWYSTVHGIAPLGRSVAVPPFEGVRSCISRISRWSFTGIRHPFSKTADAEMAAKSRSFWEFFTFATLSAFRHRLAQHSHSQRKAYHLENHYLENHFQTGRNLFLQSGCAKRKITRMTSMTTRSASNWPNGSQR